MVLKGESLIHLALKTFSSCRDSNTLSILTMRPCQYKRLLDSDRSVCNYIRGQHIENQTIK
jgi:hypothetical protein